ncbi:hypothetical protein [Dyadobacter luticola]|uniref:Uncharacterized protein n=1 Tax=Dyadobacter luticola TaxID=1979387 RepID=A0A5R9L1E1_9BACT|nr:hypothetical protein [Dyadobacter luticola]TLV02228.1 hypothetical protein FEN17_00885 [Dyadobacter luticola]
MNLEEWKENWKTVDQKLAASNVLSEQLVLTMIKNQSQSTISKSQEKMRALMLYFLLLMCVFIAILAGNPFDFTHWYQYAPCVIYALVIAAGLKIMFTDHSTIAKVTISKSNLRESLVAVIFVLEKCRAAMDRVWQFSMGAGLLICISLISRNFEKYGIEKSLLLTGANIAVVGVLYLLAKQYFKKFPDKNVQELRTQLHELAEMQNDSFGQR